MLLDRQVVAFIGRLRSVPLDRARRAVLREGGRLAVPGSSQITLAVFGHGAIGQLADGALLRRAAKFRAAGAACASERGFLRRAGLLPPPPRVMRTLSAGEIARNAGLDAGTVEALGLLDILDPIANAYEFRDLVLARQIRRLLDDGAPLSEIVSALLAIRAGPNPARPGELVRDETGRLVAQVGSYLAEHSGQLRLDLPIPDHPTPDAMVEQAEAAALDGDELAATTLYQRYLSIRPRDAVARYNFANLLLDRDLKEAASQQYRLVLGLDPSFIEAWLNLGSAAADFEERHSALAHALALDAAFPAALHNLALLLFGEGRMEESLPFWERYLALDPEPERAATARKALAACRIAATALPKPSIPVADPPEPGEGPRYSHR